MLVDGPRRRKAAGGRHGGDISGIAKPTRPKGKRVTLALQRPGNLRAGAVSLSALHSRGGSVIAIRPDLSEPCVPR